MPKPLSSIIREIVSREVLDEAEENCDEHIHPVHVRFVGDRRKHNPALIAGILRVIALYTDGRCATRDAKDADILTSTGMMFHFTSKEKAAEFKAAMRHYLDTDVLLALSIS